MLNGLWTIGVKVPSVERELEFHRAMGNDVVLDETIALDGIDYRVPLIKMGDKYLHIAEKMVYENELGIDLPYGPVHLVYLSNDFDADLANATAAGATPIREPADISAGFGERRVAFFRSPSGWIFEIAQIYRHAVPEVV